MFVQVERPFIPLHALLDHDCANRGSAVVGLLTCSSLHIVTTLKEVGSNIAFFTPVEEIEILPTVAVSAFGFPLPQLKRR